LPGVINSAKATVGLMLEQDGVALAAAAKLPVAPRGAESAA